MNLKTFRGNSMAQALAEVKKGLGNDAVILHTRTYRVGAIFGLGGRNVVEITASDQAAARDAKRQSRRPANPYGTTPPPPRAQPAQPQPTPTPRSQPPAPAPRPTQDSASLRAQAASSKDTFTPSTFQPVHPKTEIARTVKLSQPVRPVESSSDLGSSTQPRESAAPSTRDLPGEAVFPATSRHLPPNLITNQPVREVLVPVSRLTGDPARMAPVDDLALATLQSELSSIKRLVGQVLQCSRKTASTLTPSAGGEDRAGSNLPGTAAASGVLNLGGMSEPLFTLYMSLTESGVAHELVETLAGNVRDELSPGELTDEIIVGQCMLRHLAATLRVVGSLPRLSTQSDARPLVMALVGPTGVGKTTTIAKLAATFKLRHAKKVGLITADTYRIAAVEQLRTYAEIIGLPLKVVNTPAEVASAVDSLHDCDVVLLDTAGRSQHDKNRLNELGEIVAAASPHEIHLVLSSTVAEGVMRRTADRFAALNPSRIIFTKLDEAVAFGCLANIAAATRLPISFVTTGQEVPDQIELADAPRLARLVLQSQGRLVGALSEVGT
jgi:flagellar biosynthesis protein FlhF